MRGLRWMMILLSFSLEIRVKAMDQEPVDCLKQTSSPCSVFAFSPSSTKTKQFDLTMSAGSILFRDKKQEWNFVSGTIRIVNAKPIRLMTKVGVVLIGPGIKWLQWKDDKLWVYSLEGPSQVTLRSTLMRENLVPEGFYNWFGLVDREGINGQGVPQRVSPAITKMNLPGFKHHQDLRLVEKRESRGIAMASDFYKDVAQLMEDQASARQRAAEERESYRIQQEKRARQMFRDKYLSPVDLPEETSDSQN